MCYTWIVQRFMWQGNTKFLPCRAGNLAQFVYLKGPKIFHIIAWQQEPLLTQSGYQEHAIFNASKHAHPKCSELAQLPWVHKHYPCIMQPFRREMYRADSAPLALRQCF